MALERRRQRRLVVHTVWGHKSIRRNNEASIADLVFTQFSEFSGSFLFFSVSISGCSVRILSRMQSSVSIPPSHRPGVFEVHCYNLIGASVLLDAKETALRVPFVVMLKSSKLSNDV